MFVASKKSNYAYFCLGVAPFKLEKAIKKAVIYFVLTD